ncbi:heavy-metal-associated domain-containing protein [Sediminibacillus massiliensis]|uniref:heavy-metal-associated domain-containing protein n=1 Tax=Sediminibacillus massiliensis TaxID=1926277 RepID=UPI0009883A53|nr:cation transporter [Sediminibacillus massiliensis]
MSEGTFYVKEEVDQNSIQEIESTLNQIDGVERVLIDTSDGEVIVEFDNEKVTAEQITKTLEQHQYHV